MAAKSQELRAQTAVAAIRDAILRGEYRAGEPIRQTDFAHRLGCSRIPIREALRQLQAEGFVELHAFRGAIVANVDGCAAAEVAEICSLLECHALRLAIPRITASDLERADALLQSLDSTADVIEWMEIHWKFHEALYAPSGRGRLIETARAVRGASSCLMHILIAHTAWRLQSRIEHRQILDACAARDIEGAVRALAGHVRNALDTLTTEALPSRSANDRTEGDGFV
ncbi:MAG: GntR family transcriptional regulator [Phycisphaerales bacterium]|nr:GntR family transcriptional regulator [Phycisphaerales bacterium]